MSWTGWDVFIVLISLVNFGLILWIALLALKIKNGPVAAVTGRIGPLVAKGKALVDTGKREFVDNKERAQSFTDAVKGVLKSVKPANDPMGARSRFSYRHLLTLISVLGTLRRGLGEINQVRKPGANPPGPPKAKRKAPPRRLGTLELLPNVIRLVRDVRRALR